MRLIPLGDFYAWYCEWCDTRNMTMWTRIERGQVCCAACQKKFTLTADSRLAPPAAA